MSNTGKGNNGSYQTISRKKINIKHNKKLTFCSMFKTDCQKEDILNTIKNPSNKKEVNKLRIGDHRLRIEIGRHTTPQKTPRKP